MRKKLLSMILALALVLPMLAPAMGVQAAAAELNFTAGADMGDLAIDGYHWNAAERVLTISGAKPDCLKDSTIILPHFIKQDGAAVKVSISVPSGAEAHIGGIEIGGAYADLVITGEGALVVDTCFSTSQGVNLIINKDAAASFPQGINLTASSFEKAEEALITVNGKLNVNSANEGDTDIRCYGFKIGSTGEVTTEGHNGIKVTCIPGSEFRVERGGVLHAKCDNSIVLVHKESTSTMENPFRLDPSFLPEGFETKLIGGSGYGDESGYVIAPVSAEPTLDSGAVTGAGGTLTAGYCVLADASGSRHQDAGTALAYQTNMKPQWIKGVKIGNTDLTSEDYEILEAAGLAEVKIKAAALEKAYAGLTGTQTVNVRLSCRVNGSDFVTKTPITLEPHTQDSLWKTDDTNHWQECTVCGAKKDVSAHQFLLKWDGEKHWEECACGAKREEGAHTYEWVVDTTATYTEVGSKHQECTVCHHALPAEEIPIISHKHTYELQHNKDEHWQECTVCRDKKDAGAHQFLPEHDGKQHWEECQCGAKRNIKPHKDFTPNFDAHSHWEECLCGARRNEEAHGRFTPHHDGFSHWEECKCGYRKNVTLHNYEWVVDQEATENAAGSKHQHCKDCGYDTAAVAIPALIPEAKPQPNPNEPPKTGDLSHVTGYTVSLVLSLAGALALAVWTDKKVKTR